jgi:hypothetical protein
MNLEEADAASAAVATAPHVGGRGRCMKRYEYTHAVITRRDGTPMSSTDHAHPEDVDEVLNRYGAEGWRVWQLDGSIARFEREMAPDAG